MSGPLFDPDTGEVRDASPTEGECPRCLAHQARAEAIEADLHNVQKELLRVLRSHRALEAELRRQRQESPEGRVARVIFRYWCARLGKNPRRVKFGPKRERAVVGRLRDPYEPSYIARAIDGLAVGAYTNPETGVRYDDLELVCRNEVNLERYHAIAEATGAPTLISGAWLREFNEATQDSPSEPEPDTPF